MKRPVSMTAFGRGEAHDGERLYTVEVRSVNHRYCEVSVKIGRNYAALEDRVRKEVLQYFNRGRVDVTVTVAGTATTAEQVTVNLPLARQYLACLETLRRECGVADAPSLALLTGFKDVIVPAEAQEDLDRAWLFIQEALQMALAKGRAMREAEGESLRRDLAERVDRFESAVWNIETAIPELVTARHETLRERIGKLLENGEADPLRLAQEAAMLADRSDVTEEIVRLGSHIAQFREFLAMSREPVGRRLDFLMQEFFREVNTMSSKISDAGVIHQLVELKNEVEKMREQVQNIE